MLKRQSEIDIFAFTVTKKKTERILLSRRPGGKWNSSVLRRSGEFSPKYISLDRTRATRGAAAWGGQVPENRTRSYSGRGGDADERGNVRITEAEQAARRASGGYARSTNTITTCLYSLRAARSAANSNNAKNPRFVDNVVQLRFTLHRHPATAAFVITLSSFWRCLCVSVCARIYARVPIIFRKRSTTNNAGVFIYHSASQHRDARATQFFSRPYCLDAHRAPCVRDSMENRVIIFLRVFLHRCARRREGADGYVLIFDFYFLPFFQKTTPCFSRTIINYRLSDRFFSISRLHVYLSARSPLVRWPSFEN